MWLLNDILNITVTLKINRLYSANYYLSLKCSRVSNTLCTLAANFLRIWTHRIDACDIIATTAAVFVRHECNECIDVITVDWFHSRWLKSSVGSWHDILLPCMGEISSCVTMGMVRFLARCRSCQGSRVWLDFVCSCCCLVGDFRLGFVLS